MFIYFVLFNFLRTNGIEGRPLASIGEIVGSLTLESLADAADSCVCKDTRSMWDIIWSCMATIFACSWVSVHPNIPAPTDGRVKIILHRLEIMIASLIAPECIIFWAAAQWANARRIEKQYKDRGWTKTHGYFLEMGGFTLYNGSTPKGVLSRSRFNELLEAGKIEFPSISEEQINDRSKADALAKAVVLIQTTWFIAQCIARQAEHLGITELELVTAAFAALNGALYFLWWNKPMDIQYGVPVPLITPVKHENQESTDENQADVLRMSTDEVDNLIGVELEDKPDGGLATENEEINENVILSPPVTEISTSTGSDEGRVPAAEAGPQHSDSMIHDDKIQSPPAAQEVSESIQLQSVSTTSVSPPMAEHDELNSGALTLESPHADQKNEAPQSNALTTDEITEHKDVPTEITQPSGTTVAEDVDIPEGQIAPAVVKPEPNISNESTDGEDKNLERVPPTNTVSDVHESPSPQGPETKILQEPILEISSKDLLGTNNIISTSRSAGFIPQVPRKDILPVRMLKMEELVDPETNFGDPGFFVSLVLWIGVPFLYISQQINRSIVPPKEDEMCVNTFYVGETNSRERRLPAAFVIFLTTIFGGIHCAGWSFLFPTPTEQLLWRISSISMTAIPLVALGVSNSFMNIMVKSGRYSTEDKSAQSLAIKIPFSLFAFFSTSVYVCARVALLIISLTSLRRLSDSTFDDVDWTKFVPHIH